MEAHSHRDLLCDFLFTFARFEQALKAADFHQGDGRAEPDWMSFAELDQVREEFEDPDSPVAQDIAFLLDDPPRRQVVHDDNLSWDVAPVNQNLDSKTALEYVKRVRHNLFHGGKFENEGFLRDRDVDLIRSAYRILQRCTELDTEVGVQFRYMEHAG